MPYERQNDRFRFDGPRWCRFGNGTAWLEVLGIFALFFLYGAWPVPDVNEQYYIGKAIHFWDRAWLASDSFLDTPDSHWFFYATFGAFSFLLSPPALAWFGRISAWLLTAWGWQRLSRTVIDRPWCALLSGAAFLYYLDVFHLAGEWIAGGVEGKSFAFPLVFFGLADFCRGRLGRAWILLGLASAFHVLVGGWTVLACLACWTWIATRGHTFLAELRKMLPGLVVGGLIATLGLIPALMLDGNAHASTIHEAHRIYVFERLAHHLVPSTLNWTFALRFTLLTAIWLSFGRISRSYRNNERPAGIAQRLDGFIMAAIFIAILGLIIDAGSLLAVRFCWIPDRYFVAGILRFYWFRLSDWVVPMGVALGLTLLLIESARNLLARTWEERSRAAGSLIASMTLGCFVFAVIKKVLWYYSTAQAKSLTADPDYPVMPVPVDACAFLAAILVTGWIFLIVARLRKKRDENGTPPLIVTTGLGLLAFMLILAAPCDYAMDRLNLRCSTVIPRSHPPKESISDGWLDVCRWVANPEHTDPNAVFLVPRGCDSFKWYAHRALVGSWKEIPQDAASIVKWYQLMEKVYTIPGEKGAQRWNQPLVMVLISKGRPQVLQECHEEGIDYVIIENPPYVVATHAKALERYQAFYDNDLVYQNSQFTVFRIPKGQELRK